MTPIVGDHEPAGVPIARNWLIVGDREPPIARNWRGGPRTRAARAIFEHFAYEIPSLATDLL